jgi:hypothetical protein
MSTRPSPIVAYFLALVCGILFVTSMMAACTHSGRADTIHASLVAVSDARQGFTSWDLDHQRVIKDSATSREEAVVKIAAYRVKQAEIERAFELCFKALGFAATQNDDPSLSKALQEADDLIAAVKALRQGGP